MGFFRQEYWSGLPFPPGNLLDPGIEPKSPALADRFFTTESFGKAPSEVAQLCSTLRDPMDCSPPGSSVHGIFQARILEWVAISYSRDLPDPGIELTCRVSLVLAGRFFATALPGKP